MPLRTITWSGDKPLGTAASLTLHLAVGAALLLLPQVRRIELPLRLYTPSLRMVEP